HGGQFPPLPQGPFQYGPDMGPPGEFIPMDARMAGGPAWMYPGNEQQSNQELIGMGMVLMPPPFSPPGLHLGNMSSTTLEDGEGENAGFGGSDDSEQNRQEEQERQLELEQQQQQPQQQQEQIYEGEYDGEEFGNEQQQQQQGYPYADIGSPPPMPPVQEFMYYPQHGPPPHNNMYPEMMSPPLPHMAGMPPGLGSSIDGSVMMMGPPMEVQFPVRSRAPVTLKDPVTGDLKMVFMKGSARRF
ncbi:hypothetical protein HDU76_012965, partial [Blyttiomyces sp. JEL0837]